MEHLILRIFFRALKPMLDPVFLAKQLPELYIFYPTQKWYKEQKMIIAFSSQEKKLDVPFAVQGKLLAKMLFWEYKPAKLILISFVLLLTLIAFKPMMAVELFYGLFVMVFVFFVFASTYNSENFIAVGEYVLKEFRNRALIRKNFWEHSDYNQFVQAYHKKSYYKIGAWIMPAFICAVWLFLIALILVVGIIAWR